MDKIHYSGISKDALSADQKAKLEALATVSDDLVGITCYSNFQCLDDESLPIGIAMYFKPNATVDSTLISDNLFEILAVSKIIEGPYDKIMNDGHFAQVGSNIEQHSKNPVSLGVLNAKKLQVKTWNNEIGGVNSFIGAFTLLHDNHRDKDYYLIARGSAPKVVQDLKQDIQEKLPTYRDLLYDPAWQCKISAAASLCKSNILRNLASVAMEHSVSIARDADKSAKTTSLDHAMPEMARPTFQQNSHSFKSAMYKGQQTVAFYYGVVPKESLNNSKTLFVAADPSDKIYMFPISSIITTTVAAAAPCNNDNGLTKDFKNVMKSVGWDHENPAKVLVCVGIKQYDPKIKRVDEEEED